MPNLVSQLIIRLKDEITGPAKGAAGSLKQIDAAAKSAGKGASAEINKLSEALNRAKDAGAKVDVFQRMRRELPAARSAFNQAQERVKALAAEMAALDKPTLTMQRALQRARTDVKRAAEAFDTQKRAVLEAKGALAEFGIGIGNLAGAEGRLKASIDQTTGALTRQAEAERIADQRNRSRMDRIRQRREIIGNGAAVAGVYLGYKARETGQEAVEQAASFDIAVRKQKAFTGISDDEQSNVLLPQAKRIAQATQFTNIDLVEAQTRTLQGLPMNLPRAKVAEAITEQAKNYALALGTDMTTAAEAIRGYLASTGKDISTQEKAVREAMRATNMMIRAAKLGGMDDEDVRQFAKYGAASSTVAGFSDETRMAIGAGMRRAGVRGDEAGVFLRSISSKMVAPTPKGLAALTTAGINYDDFTTMPGGGLNADALENKFKLDFGLKFTPEIREALKDVLDDEDVINDRGEFTKAVIEATSDLFVKKSNGDMRAADVNKLVKKIGEFHKFSVESVDVEGLLTTIMKKDPTLAILNAFFTDKQGGRAAILGKGMENFLSDREALTNTPDNFGDHIATEIMAGLGGSLERFKGSVENSILAIGQANEGLIRLGLDGVGTALDGFSSLSDNAKRAATALGAAAAGWVWLRGTGKLLATFSGTRSAVALTGSAAALTGSAEALNLAAVRLSGAAGVGAAGRGVGAGAAAAGGAAAGGAWAVAKRWLGPIGIGLIAKEVLDNTDPGGNLWGMTDGIDGWVEKNLGFNPSKVPVGGGGPPKPEPLSGTGTRSNIDPATWERSQRATEEWRSDPEAARGRVMMEMGAKADETKASLEALDATKVAPIVDTTSIDEAQKKATRLAETFRTLSALSLSVKAPSAPVAPAGVRGVHADTGLGVE
ncbi:phage tail tape measure protein [Kaistia algarum]|uniref:phage tail tape measure protein n=1 Tax=Kaistia algarum TaxID=2083279 RepID=UPI000CE8F3F7|nr:phage tail tape measure protein [Kaistia algarum]MCX5513372.1 phage tail tape measure protein [Kaistia algarum]PPE81179.1 phage tail tape measure protein [Kaistia algarum]